MKLNRIAAAATTAAAIALISGAAITHHGSAPMTLTADTHSTTAHPATAHPATAHTAHSHAAQSHPAARTAPANRSLAWLESPGGQAQVTLNTDIDTLAADLQIEAHAPTVANHLAFEADARTVRTQAHTILTTRALLPTHNRAAYQRMLKDFITVANLLQPGPGYGTTPQDYTAWYTALKASNITIW
jgi:hypothetical protein